MQTIDCRAIIESCLSRILTGPPEAVAIPATCPTPLCVSSLVSICPRCRRCLPWPNISATTPWRDLRTKPKDISFERRFYGVFLLPSVELSAEFSTELAGGTGVSTGTRGSPGDRGERREGMRFYTTPATRITLFPPNPAAIVIFILSVPRLVFFLSFEPFATLCRKYTRRRTTDRTRPHSGGVCSLTGQRCYILTVSKRKVSEKSGSAISAINKLCETGSAVR